MHCFYSPIYIEYLHIYIYICIILYLHVYIILIFIFLCSKMLDYRWWSFLLLTRLYDSLWILHSLIALTQSESIGPWIYIQSFSYITYIYMNILLADSYSFCFPGPSFLKTCCAPIHRHSTRTYSFPVGLPPPASDAFRSFKPRWFRGVMCHPMETDQTYRWGNQLFPHRQEGKGGVLWTHG